MYTLSLVYSTYYFLRTTGQVKNRVGGYPKYIFGQLSSLNFEKQTEKSEQSSNSCPCKRKCLESSSIRNHTEL